MDHIFGYGWQGAALLAWLSLSVGSFLNVVIYRLPVMLDREWHSQARAILELTEAQPEGTPDRFNLAVPRSRCPSCQHQLKAWENIPVFSWLLLRGRCSQCASAISARYPAIELLAAVSAFIMIGLFGFSWMGFFCCLFSWMLIALCFIDYDTKLLPDQITYPLLWLGLISNTFFQGLVSSQEALIGAIAGYLFLWVIYWSFKLTTGKEGMGYGDFKLLAALGAWLGWQALPNIVLLAALSGLAYALLQIIRSRQNRGDPIPFGPFLAIGGWAALIFHDSLVPLS